MIRRTGPNGVLAVAGGVYALATSSNAVVSDGGRGVSAPTATPCPRNSGSPGEPCSVIPREDGARVMR
ncbi:hypothetical protein [Streptomyces wuyuanensis]|uniref:hypothetical protein n=1 Tax=Streptomyces wuyuanensis TaxID=1196353 RepID=UPI00342D5B1B